MTVKIQSKTSDDYIQQLDKFRSVCSDFKVKPLLIELESLQNNVKSTSSDEIIQFPTQMMTSSYVNGNLGGNAQKEAFRFVITEKEVSTNQKQKKKTTKKTTKKQQQKKKKKWKEKAECKWICALIKFL